MKYLAYLTDLISTRDKFSFLPEWLAYFRMHGPQYLSRISQPRVRRNRTKVQQQHSAFLFTQDCLSELFDLSAFNSVSRWISAFFLCGSSSSLLACRPIRPALIFRFTVFTTELHSHILLGLYSFFFTAEQIDEASFTTFQQHNGTIATGFGSVLPRPPSCGRTLCKQAAQTTVSDFSNRIAAERR